MPWLRASRAETGERHPGASDGAVYPRSGAVRTGWAGSTIPPTACSGAALLGAPLTHDFAVVSLSDRLTPWDKIAARLRGAAQADLSLVLYNPASRGRPDHLRRACEILLETLPADRPCGIARMIGREGESGRILTLGELRDAEVDMFCTVFIGNAQTRALGGRLITPRGYRDV